LAFEVLRHAVKDREEGFATEGGQESFLHNGWNVAVGKDREMHRVAESPSDGLSFSMRRGRLEVGSALSIAWV